METKSERAQEFLEWLGSQGKQHNQVNQAELTRLTDMVTSLFVTQGEDGEEVFSVTKEDATTICTGFMYLGHSGGEIIYRKAVSLLSRQIFNQQLEILVLRGILGIVFLVVLVMNVILPLWGVK